MNIDIRSYVKPDYTFEVDPASFISKIGENLPPGWRDGVSGWWEEISEFISISKSVENIIVSIDRGLLRIKVVALPIHERIFERYSQHIAAESAKVCMVCGTRGYRRRENGRPVLCTLHYIEYLNFLDRIGELDTWLSRLR